MIPLSPCYDLPSASSRGGKVEYSAYFYCGLDGPRMEYTGHFVARAKWRKFQWKIKR